MVCNSPCCLFLRFLGLRGLGFLGFRVFGGLGVLGFRVFRV